MKNENVAVVLNISMRQIDRVKKRFVAEGLEIALDRRKGERVYRRKANGDCEAHLVALSCSQPREGFSRWPLRLLVDRVVELANIDSVSYETVWPGKKRNQALEKAEMGYLPRAKGGLCRCHGRGSQCLQMPLQY